MFRFLTLASAVQVLQPNVLNAGDNVVKIAVFGATIITRVVTVVQNAGGIDRKSVV